VSHVRRPSRCLSLLLLLVVGPLLAWVVVGAGAPLQSRQERTLLGSWLTASTWPWELVGQHVDRHRALVVAVAGLVLAWLGVAWGIRRASVGPRVLGAGVGLWSLPFVLGPPFLSRDAYAYLAQGQLLLQGMDPYRQDVSQLGSRSALLQAVDPLWRHTVPPYGPLALRLEELVAWVGGGRVWVSLVALRVLVLACVAVSVWLVRRWAPPAERGLVTWLACSPLVLLQLIGALHLEAVLCVLLLVTATLAREGRHLTATVVATAAAEIKVTAVLLLVVLVVQAASRSGVRAACRVAAVSGATAALGVLLLPQDPFGWVPGLLTPGRAWVPFTPTSTLYLIVTDLTHRRGVYAGPDLRAVISGVSLVVGAALLALVLVRARRHDLGTAAGTALLVVLLAGPVLFPWYLAPSALLLLAARRYLPALLLGAVPALAALPVGIVFSQRTSFVAELLGLVGLLAVLVTRRLGSSRLRPPARGGGGYGASWTSPGDRPPSPSSS
jgi:alpha-1,6-mannosyltransferase